MVDSASAFHRAHTPQCKDRIENAACYLKVANSLDYTYKHKRLQSKCQATNEIKTYKPIGCVLNQTEFKIELNAAEIAHVILNDTSIYNHEVCIDYCQAIHGFFYAIFSRTEKQCYCIRNLTIESYKLNTDNCDYPIYETGRLSI